MNIYCPKCHSPLQEGARFCPHCMTKLDEKQKIEKPKSKLGNTRRKIAIAMIVLAVVAVIAVPIGIFAYHQKHQPLCSYAQFQKAVPLVSERMQIDGLWESEGFKDIAYSEKEDVMQYSTDVHFGEGYLSVFFYNEGEAVYGYFCDVLPEDFDKAENILLCITQSVCNNYFTDIDEIFRNEKLYPKRTLDTPFESTFTDLLLRTEQYNAVLSAGGSISTKYIPMENDGTFVVFYVTERNEGGTVLYDLAVGIERL